MAQGFMVNFGHVSFYWNKILKQNPIRFLVFMRIFLSGEVLGGKY